MWICKYIELRGCITVSMLLVATSLCAQLSPGDLADVHAHLEGLFNCTKCHDLGKGISEQKCLDCHILLQERIMEDEGYHASEPVKSNSCISCHSDHNGRSFDIIRFDEESFDHALTGYPLQGAHGHQDCAACHQPEYIQRTDIKEKQYTFLGLEQECLQCHEDYHQNTLSTSCTDCHDYEAFDPAVLFDHQDTDYPLFGAHLDVDCIDCHALTERNGEPFQEFANVDHNNCVSCHEDVHNNAFGQDCKSCHSEVSFQILQDDLTFDHSATKFPLRGSHAVVSCIECHKDGTDNRFQEFTNLIDFKCANCHDNPHIESMDDDCVTCHNERSFRRLNEGNTFSHDQTAYPLLGKHTEVHCDQCHAASKIESLPHDQCNHCHEDYHQGQFTSKGIVRDCATCHTVDDFSTPAYTIEQHSETDFPLQGAHLATPCTACHLASNEEWQFVNLEIACVGCHDDVHGEELDARFYPEKRCDNCHVSDSWSEVTFDHDQTDFVLVGQHLEAKCNDCHLPPGIITGQRVFDGLASECVSCHQDIHHGQFLEQGLTDCSRCHLPNDWSAAVFNHDSTAFKLEGAHVDVECRACHKTTREHDQTTYIIYRIDNFECISCHF